MPANVTKTAPEETMSVVAAIVDDYNAGRERADVARISVLFHIWNRLSPNERRMCLIGMNFRPSLAQKLHEDGTLGRSAVDLE